MPINTATTHGKHVSCPHWDAPAPGHPLAPRLLLCPRQFQGQKGLRSSRTNELINKVQID